MQIPTAQVEHQVFNLYCLLVDISALKIIAQSTTKKDDWLTRLPG